MTLTDWKNLSITQEIFTEIKRRQDEIKEELIPSAGKNPIVDSFRSGAIMALEDVLTIELNEESHS